MKLKNNNAFLIFTIIIIIIIIISPQNKGFMHDSYGQMEQKVLALQIVYLNDMF